MNFNVLFAIFRRNFVSYFSNPTGYVFLCVFVLLSSFAAFWPNEFFTSNLANLDQLNKWLPYILLVFIPAITMSVWAEERRLGTDELLLTIPAGDPEVVLGKYLAAVAIYSCSLAFSAISNYAVLAWLGDPDLGLFLGNYFGYWMVGLTMLAIGMVASFLTANITVGFVLGAIFNAPLVFAAAADVILPSTTAAFLPANTVKRWSIEAAFRDFGRGVISISGLCYLILMTAVMLYLCTVLIGRRHWWGGKNSNTLLGHYLGRTLALIVIAVCLTVFFTRHDMRADVTSEQLTALSPKTKTLLRDLKPKDTIIIEAFVSPDMPESLVQTRMDLVNLLREMESRGGNNIEVRIHDTEPHNPAAQLAREQYDIGSQRVRVSSSGADTSKEVYMGVVVMSGGEKVVIPFINRGIPVEYELIRSIATVGRTSDDRPKLGIIKTGAETGLDGRPARFGQAPQERGILTELRKQFDVEMVDIDRPITKKYRVVLAVQPSSLSQPQLENFQNLIKSGQPTVIFEDPVPAWPDFQSVAGTDDPKQPDPAMGGFNPAMMNQMPKGNIKSLWSLLGVEFNSSEVVLDKHNPYPKFGDFPPELVFAHAQPGGKAFRQDNRITSGLQEMLFAYCGSIKSVSQESGLNYTPLVFTSRQTGRVAKRDLEFARSEQDRAALYTFQSEEQAIVAQIRGQLKSDKSLHPGHDEKSEDKTDASGDAKSADAKTAESTEINVVLVADIDCLSATFLQLRALGPDEREYPFNFDNVTFVLNALDSLADDDRFIDIRSRRRKHRSLTEVDAAIEKSTKASMAVVDKARKKLKSIEDEGEKRLKDEEDRIRQQPGLTVMQMNQEIQNARQNAQRKFITEVSRVRQETQRTIQKEETNREQAVRSIRNWYKYVAVVLPPLFPLLLGLVVFFNRRAKEREGVPETRLRQNR